VRTRLVGGCSGTASGKEEAMTLAVGKKAPDFTLVDTERKPRNLSEFKGKKLILAFYPAAFTGVCTKEMCAFRDTLGEMGGLGAAVVGVSVDTPFANKVFAEQNKITFPLLSDYARQAIAAYGVQFPNLAGLTGYTAAKRSVFVLDREGVIRYMWVSDDPTKEPNYEEVKQAVRQLK
jgi:glutaredoxin-dependent peroxiredoxin